MSFSIIKCKINCYDYVLGKYISGKNEKKFIISRVSISQSIVLVCLLKWQLSSSRSSLDQGTGQSWEPGQSQNEVSAIFQIEGFIDPCEV